MTALSAQYVANAHRWNLVCSATGMRSYGSAKDVAERTVPEMLPKLPQGGGRNGLVFYRPAAA